MLNCVKSDGKAYMNSTIKRKRCKGECGRYPVLGLSGWCYKCVPEEIKAKVGTKRELAKKNKNARNRVSNLLNQHKLPVSGAELKRWFADRRKEMTGRCDNCQYPTCKNDDDKFHYSIAHILPKAYFKSVATHPFNYLELCFWGLNSCHTQMDNKMIDLTEMACWDKIVTRFVAMYPDIAPEERRRIPQILLQYVEVEK